MYLSIDVKILSDEPHSPHSVALESFENGPFHSKKNKKGRFIYALSAAECGECGRHRAHATVLKMSSAAECGECGSHSKF